MVLPFISLTILFLEVAKLKTKKKIVALTVRTIADFVLCHSFGNVSNFDLVLHSSYGGDNETLWARRRHTKELFNLEGKPRELENDKVIGALLARPLRVSFVPFSPFTIIDANGDKSGIDVKLWNATAKYLEVDIEYVDVTFVPDMVTVVSWVSSWVLPVTS